MKLGSLFSGIGGFDLGFEQAGFEVAWQVEFDKHAQGVLRRHWPDTQQFGDVREVGKHNLSAVDVLVGGFPCQDLSVAGRRAGLAGERSGLFYEFARIIGELEPTWVVIENVPGLLSSRGGRDMGAVLGTLSELGYGWAYRVLDAQYLGVPQRRRRVFIVGCSGGRSQRAAEVLLEPESLRGDSPPSRAPGKEVAGTLGGGAPGERGYRNDLDSSGAYVLSNRGRVGGSQVEIEQGGVAPALRSGNGGASNGAMVFTGGVASPLTASAGHHGHSSPRGDGSDNLVYAIEDPGGKMSGGPEVGLGVSESVMYTLPADPSHQHAVYAAFDERNITSKTNRSTVLAGAPTPTVHQGGLSVISIQDGREIEKHQNGLGVSADGVAYTIDGTGAQSVAYSLTTEQAPKFARDLALTLTKQSPSGGGQTQAVGYVPGITGALSDGAHHGGGLNGQDAYSGRVLAPRGVVRRLTPKECERLQGFDDDWTAGQADSHRYRQIGNAVAVGVAYWVANRLKLDHAKRLSPMD